MYLVVYVSCPSCPQYARDLQCEIRSWIDHEPMPCTCGLGLHLARVSLARPGTDNMTLTQDPRQFVPPSGQSFTTLAKLRADGYKNVIEKSNVDEGVYEIWTEPKVRP
jgi:hypothetical protein